MNLKNATRPLLLGLFLAATLSACDGRKICPKDYAKARVQQLISFLSSDKADVRCQAAFGLGQIPKYAKDAVPALTCTLSDSVSEVRDMAAWALCRIDMQRDTDKVVALRSR